MIIFISKKIDYSCTQLFSDCTLSMTIPTIFSWLLNFLSLAFKYVFADSENPSSTDTAVDRRFRWEVLGSHNNSSARIVRYNVGDFCCQWYAIDKMLQLYLLCFWTFVAKWSCLTRNLTLAIILEASYLWQRESNVQQASLIESSMDMHCSMSRFFLNVIMLRRTEQVVIFGSVITWATLELEHYLLFLVIRNWRVESTITENGIVGHWNLIKHYRVISFQKQDITW